jgi:hypothetical protein
VHAVEQHAEHEQVQREQQHQRKFGQALRARLGTEPIPMFAE